MKTQIRGTLKYVSMAVIGGGLIGGGVFLAPMLLRHLSPEASEAADSQAAPVVELVSGKDAIRLPKEVAARLGVETEVVEHSAAPIMLELSGTLMLDSDRLSHVHARFPGEIVELGDGDGQVAGGLRPACPQGAVAGGDLEPRPGREEKRADRRPVATSRRRRRACDRISKAAGRRGRSRPHLRDAERKVEADRIAVSRAVRTLQSWRISKEEIDDVRAEADRLARDAKPDREELVAQWARLEVRAPLDGVIIERNVALGDLVDTSTDLFKIADLSRLGVLAHAYEEDLPTLDALPDSQRAWSVTVGAGRTMPPAEGRFDQVGCIIDPNQHTALVMGWVDNPDGRLRVGQFVTTRLEFAAAEGEVVIPASALCEESGRTIGLRAVRRQSDDTSAAGGRHPPRGDKVFIRSQLTAEEKAPRAGAAAAGRAGGRVAGRAVDGQHAGPERQLRSVPAM